MKTYRNLWQQLISFDNLQQAYEKAKKHKSSAPSVKAFAEQWVFNLAHLRYELKTKTYRPAPLRRFVLRDPKTRVICKSHFRDRIVHHALINILLPIFEPRFIHDSYASRRGKGTSKAIDRYEAFLAKATRNGALRRDAKNNNHVIGFALKCDIKHYFETVDHDVLLSIIRKLVKDDDVLELTKIILEHYPSEQLGKGMPLGNWTSQFFANVYLNELDQFVKHVLKAKYYLRYVDDFVILHQDRRVLENHLISIGPFLEGLRLELHPTKCKIIPLKDGVGLLGFKIFTKYKIVRKKNKRTITAKLNKLLRRCENGVIDHQLVLDTLRGWNAYAKQANTYCLRRQLMKTTMMKMDRIAARHAS